ncbi:hypothetical protein KH5_24100 [Urechidicola sp. KH5]
MIRSLISLLLLIGFFTVHAQEINQVDSNGERHGVWKKNHKNGRIRYEGTFDHGKEVGVFKFYSMNTSDFPVVVKTFKDGIAFVEFFTEKGVKESDGNMKGKERVDTWKYYHNNGVSVMIEENYQNGELNGDYKVYYLNGKVTQEATYKNGKFNGIAKKYSQKGVMVEMLTYVDGVLNGPAAFYELDGELIMKGIYENDLKIGQWQFYEDGKLSQSKDLTPSKND